MIIDHVGIVVRSLELGIVQWESLFGYTRETEIVTNTRQKVRVVFLSKADSVGIKLIEPSEPSSPIAELARRGGGVHHLCFRCGDLQAEIPALQARGARLIVPPQPGEAFDEHDIAFLFVPGGLNIELIDTMARRGRLSDSVKSPESGVTACAE